MRFGHEFMIFKTVEFSYPTSPNAVKFGFGKVGCWTVETAEDSNPPKAVKGFSLRDDALAYAESLEFSWSPIFLRFHPQYAAKVVDLP